MTEISVIILNYKRPNNLKEVILPSLCNQDPIKQIILSHGLPDTYFYYDHQKVQNYSHYLEQKHLGVLRKLGCAHYVNRECVLVLDDDILLNEKSINTLKRYWENDKSIIHGVFGRKCTHSKYFPANINNGDVPIVGGRAFICHRSLLVDAYSDAYIIDDIQHDFPVVWNGEDIYLSLYSMARNNRLNRVYNNIQYSELPANDAISQIEGHYEHRDKVVEKCFERLVGFRN